MEKVSLKHLSKVIFDPETGYPCILFSEELIKDLAFRDNEVLEWEISKDSFMVRRTGIIHNKKEENNNNE